MEKWITEIGFITPPGPPNLIREFLEIRPKGIGLRQVILNLEDRAGLLSEQERIDFMINELERAVKILDMCEVGVITQCGIPFIFTKEPGFEKQLKESFEKLTKIPIVFMASAGLDALRALNAKKLNVTTYYSENLNRLYKKYLESNGFVVSKIMGLPETASLKPPNVKYSQITEERIFEFARQVHQESPDADAIVVTGGAVRSLNILKRLEDELGVPAISTNQAMFWKLFDVLNVHDDLSAYGSLMSMLPKR